MIRGVRVSLVLSIPLLLIVSCTGSQSKAGTSSSSTSSPSITSPSITSLTPLKFGIATAEVVGGGEPLDVSRPEGAPTSAGSLIGGPIDVRTADNGQPTAPVHVSFHYDPVKLSDGNFPVIVHYDSVAEQWNLEPSTYNPATATVSANVTSLSWMDVWDWFTWLGGTATANRTDGPDGCGKLPAWVEGIAFDNNRNTALRSCMSDDNGTAVLHVVNNRGYPYTLTFSGAIPSVQIRNAAKLDSLGYVTDAIALLHKDRVVLGPGDEATLTYTRQDAAETTVHVIATIDGLSYLASIITAGLHTVLDLPDRVRGSELRTVLSASGAMTRCFLTIPASAFDEKDAKAAGAVSGLENCEPIFEQVLRDNSVGPELIKRYAKYMKALSGIDLAFKFFDGFADTIGVNEAQFSMHGLKPTIESLGDFKNVTLPAGTCATSAWTSPFAIALNGGKGHAGHNGGGPTNYVEATVAGAPMLADLNGDGQTDAVLPIDCTVDSKTHLLFAVPLTLKGFTLRLLGNTLAAVAGPTPDASKITSVELSGTTIITHESYQTNPVSPVRQATVRWAWDGAKWNQRIAQGDSAVMTVDFLNTTFPAGVCRAGPAWPDPLPITVANGKGHSGNRDSGTYSEILGVGVLGYFDIDGDQIDDAVIDVGCTAGGIVTDGVVSVLTMKDGRLAFVGGHALAPAAGGGHTASRQGPVGPVLNGSLVVVDEQVQIGDEALCCYTGNATVVWAFKGGEWTSEVTNFSGGPTLAEATQTLTSYFLAAGAHQYQQAWDMLGGAYQDKYGGFEKFKVFWGGIRTAGIEGTSVVGRSLRNGTTIRADVWFDLPNGNRSLETVGVDVERSVMGVGQIGDYRFIDARRGIGG
jgi:hypothetical protein